MCIIRSRSVINTTGCWYVIPFSLVDRCQHFQKTAASIFKVEDKGTWGEVVSDEGMDACQLELGVDQKERCD